MLSTDIGSTAEGGEMLNGLGAARVRGSRTRAAVEMNMEVNMEVSIEVKGWIVDR
jgi:hypothetical protein